MAAVYAAAVAGGAGSGPLQSVMSTITVASSSAAEDRFVLDLYNFNFCLYNNISLFPRRCPGIYPNLIVICVPSLAEIAHLDGIFSIIITSMLLGGTLPTHRLVYVLLHLRTNYSVAASSLSLHILSLYSLLAYFPGVALVFIYPNLIVMCVPSLTDLHTVTSLH
jgi:hypothetical protein